MLSQTPTRPSRSGLWATCLAVAGSFAALTFAVWRILGSPVWGADDANIFFVYAKNVAQGHGIIYSVGQGHVEGYSSVLYFLICTIGYVLTPTPEKGLFLLNFLFAVATSVCLLRLIALLAERLNLGRPVKVLFMVAYLLWMAANPAYFAWTVVSLMDSGVFSMLITLSYALLATMALKQTTPTRSETLQLTVLVALTILARPEGPAWAALQIAAFAYVCWLRAPSVRHTAKALALPIAGFLCTFLALLAFRKGYFGYPLPNTFYAKVSSSPIKTYFDGRGYLGRFTRLYGPFVVLPLCVGIAWIAYALATGKRKSLQFDFALLTAAFALTGICLPMLEGGDHFGAFRLYQNIYPLLGVSLLLPLVPFAAAGKASRSFGYVAILALLLVVTDHGSWSNFRASNVAGEPTERRQFVRIEFTVAAEGRENGARLAQMFAPDLPSIGVAAAGGIALDYPGPVYDLMGLNNVEMAHADKIKSGPKGHESFSKDVFYKQAPDIFVPVAVPAETMVDLVKVAAFYDSTESFENKIYKNIFADEPFKSAYQLAAVQSPSQPGLVTYGYFRRSYLDPLVAAKKLTLVDVATP